MIGVSGEIEIERLEDAGLGDLGMQEWEIWGFGIADLGD